MWCFGRLSIWFEPREPPLRAAARSTVHGVVFAILHPGPQDRMSAKKAGIGFPPWRSVNRAFPACPGGPRGLYQRLRAAIDDIRAVRARRQRGLSPWPSLEESALPVLNAGLSLDRHVQGPGKSTYRTCSHAAGPLLRPLAIGGRQGLRSPDTSRAIRPSTRTAGKYPALENKWLPILRLPIILPATISPRCSTNPLPAATCRKAPSSRASLLRLKRTWPSSTSA